jgi:IS5 family transposase
MWVHSWFGPSVSSGDSVSQRRSVAECSFRVLEQRYGDRLAARTWYGQFRELVLKAAVKNIDNGIGASHC